MPNGRPIRRTTPRLASGLLVLGLILMATGPGCQRFSLRGPEAAPAATDAGPPRDLPALPSTPLGAVPGPAPERAGAERASATSPAPTPLLDAAIARTEAIGPAPIAPAESDPIVLPDMAEKAEPKAADTAKAAPPEPKASETPSTPAKEPEPQPKPIDPEKTPEPVAHRDEWAESLGRLRALANRRAGEPGDEGEAWAIRSRVLDWLAGDRPGPVAESDRVWNNVLAALSAATSPETPDEPALAHHLNAAVVSLEAYAPLQIHALTLCRKVQGFGNYLPLEDPAVAAGQPLLVYCEMEGLKYEEGEGAFRSRLSSRVEVLPAGGGEPVWSRGLGTAEDLCRRRRRDYYVNYRIVLPGKTTLAPGDYGLRLTQTDLVSGRSVASSVPFRVAP